MNLRNKWTIGLVTLGSAAVISLSAGVVYAQSATATPDQAPVAAPQRLDPHQDHSAILAEVLGISNEELQAAVEKARDAALAQAVADGKLTQEQADAVKARNDERGLNWGPLGTGADHDAELAEALGISLDALKAAKAEVNTRVLADAVTSGQITQAEADLMAVRQALAEYVRAPMEAAYKAAVAQAVTAGVVTQEQADQILSENGGTFGPGFGGPRPDRGLGGPHGAGGPLGDPSQAPSDSPLQPDSTPQQ